MVCWIGSSSLGASSTATCSVDACTIEAITFSCKAKMSTSLSTGAIRGVSGWHWIKLVLPCSFCHTLASLLFLGSKIEKDASGSLAQQTAMDAVWQFLQHLAHSAVQQIFQVL